MTFNPQYEYWGIEDFLSSDDATFSNPTTIQIVDGVATLVPSSYTGALHSYNVIWDPVTSWTIENNLDTTTGISNQFTILSSTGYNSTLSGSYGHSGDQSQVAFYTSTSVPVTGSNGAYTSGATSCFTYNAESFNVSKFARLTIEASVRTLPETVTHDLYSSPSSGVSCHGIYIGGTVGDAFIEIHPDGLKVHGVTGAVIPGDFGSSAKRIRVVRTSSSLLVMTEDGKSLYVPTGILSSTATSKYIAFGAFPVLTGDVNFTGTTTSGFHSPSHFFDPYGLTGIAGLEGTTLWDDVDIKIGEATSVVTDGTVFLWPTGAHTLYTAPWYPNKNANKYLGSVIDSIQVGLGVTTVSPQYLTPSGSSGLTTWTDYNSSISLTNKSYSSNYLDLGNVPLYKGLDNAIRFKIQMSGNVNGPSPQIDTITTIAQPVDDYVNVVPNWKLSCLPKNIYFILNKQKYAETIPAAHYQDEIYIHNEQNVPLYSVGEYIQGGQHNLSSGLVLSTTGGTGITSIEDGIYGPALRSFNRVGTMTGIFYSNVFREINTGIFAGNLLNSFDVYPSVSQLPAPITGTATCTYSIDQFIDTEGEFVTAQNVLLQGYTGTTNSGIGLQLTGLIGPSTNGLAHVYEGVIQVNRGSGVVATLSNGSESYSYFIDGYNYRKPKPFSYAALFTGSAASPILHLGFTPRTGNAIYVDPTIWGEWTEDIEYQNKDEFTLYNVTGYLAKPSYLQYSTSGNPARYSNLDDNSIYQTIPYGAVRRDSLIFEGFIRPYGFTGTSQEALLFQDVSPDNRGLNVYVDRSGNIRATVDLNISAAALGFTGTDLYPVYATANKTVHTGQTGSISLTSNLETVSFGSWNHIGVYQDVRSFGDTFTADNQPVIADQAFNHGARTAKLYLELNSHIVDSQDIAVDAYSLNIVSGSVVAPSYPAADVSTICMPRIPVYATSGSFRTGTIGQHIMCDFDHVRFGIRSAVDAKTASTVYGNKETPPSFIPWNAIKIPVLNSGSVAGRQYGHIYRFDHPTTYQGWDDGFGINHGLVFNHVQSAEITSRGIKASKFFASQVNDGPKGRPALRLGPGTNVIIPWSSYDERLLNGSGSCALAQGTSAANSGLFYYNTGTWLHGNMATWYAGTSGHNETTSNSRIAFGGKFRLHNYPTGSMYGDLMVFEECYAPTNYSTAGVYIAVNSGGQIVYGTRRTAGGSVFNGVTNRYVVGPFTGGGIIPLESWYHIGIDAKLGMGTGYLNVYTGEVLASTTGVTMTLSGGLAVNTGRPIGYQGLLGGQTGSLVNTSCFVIGGEHPKNLSRTFSYMDMDVSECYILFPFTGTTIDFSYFGSTGSQQLSGHTDVSVKNSSTVVAPVVGTGAGLDAYYFGITTYPATGYSAAGEHLFWATANAGNDPENKNDFGVSLRDSVIFNNAESYYAIYEDNKAVEAFGTIDSPIQLLPQVPPEGINLALITNKEWNSDYALSSFDLSDQNYSNIANVNGDATIQSFFAITGVTGLISSGTISSDDIRVSSYPVWSIDSSNTSVGYFAHLIGGDKKGLYAPSAYGHYEASSDYTLYHLNADKVEKLVTITDSDGNRLSFDEFPYSIVVSPYGPDTDLNSVSSLLGYGSVVTGQFNEDGLFTCLLICHDQTIGKSVFINYPSKQYNGTVINLQDSDVYNPIPLMKKVEYSEAVDRTGMLIVPSGSFSVNHGYAIKGYNLTVWGATLSGWI